MKITLPEITKQIYQEDVLETLKTNFNEVANNWWKHQLAWIHGVYNSFHDHNKFLITIYLIKKTLDFYSRNFTKFSMDEFYANEKIEIEKFNVIEISKFLLIPKETVRRKLIELENDGAILRRRKKILIDRSC